MSTSPRQGGQAEHSRQSLPSIYNYEKPRNLLDRNSILLRLHNSFDRFKKWKRPLLLQEKSRRVPRSNSIRLLCSNFDGEPDDWRLNGNGAQAQRKNSNSVRSLHFEQKQRAVLSRGAETHQARNFQTGSEIRWKAARNYVRYTQEHLHARDCLQRPELDHQRLLRVKGYGAKMIF